MKTAPFRRSSKIMAFLAGGAFAVLAFVSGGQEALAAACPSGQSWCSEHNQCEAPLTDEEAKAKIKKAEDEGPARREENRKKTEENRKQEQEGK